MNIDVHNLLDAPQQILSFNNSPQSVGGIYATQNLQATDKEVISIFLKELENRDKSMQKFMVDILTKFSKS